MRNLKKLSVMLLSISVLFLSCEVKRSGLSGRYTLALQQPKELSSYDPAPTLTFTEVTDSRCPLPGNCVWEGNALATVKVSANGTDETLKLCLGSCNMVTETNSFVFNDVAYQVTLNDVSPYPGTPNASSTKTVRLTITRK